MASSVLVHAAGRLGRDPRPLPRNAFSFVILAILLLSILPTLSPPVSAGGDLVLRVGGKDEMKTRNPLPATANDVWTSDVLDRVYEGPTKMSADGTVLPYIAKGVDANEDGVFERSEYGVWQERPAPSTPSDVTVYYDFNGVRWHDGMQMEAWDLIFSYHLNAMNGRFNQNLRVLYCSPYVSYDGCNRRLGVSV